MIEPVVVVGAGFLGRAAANAVVASGRPTTLLTRRAVPGVTGADTVTCDLGDRLALRAAIQPGTTVVYAAGNSVPAADEHHPGRAAAEVTPLVSVLESVRPRTRRLAHLPVVGRRGVRRAGRHPGAGDPRAAAAERVRRRQGGVRDLRALLRPSPRGERHVAALRERLRSRPATRSRAGPGGRVDPRRARKAGRWRSGATGRCAATTST